MKLGIGFFTWGSMALGAVSILIGSILWSNGVDGAGVLCIAVGAGLVLLGFMIMMTEMIMTMSVESVKNAKGKRGGPL